jgi:RHS repeat-associated protein
MSQIRSSRSRRGKTFSSKVNRRRLVLEPLESRQLLATVTWNNPSGGSWDDASNWSPTPFAAGDDVIINDLNPGAAVTISSTVESVNSITATGLLDISGGGLTAAASSTLSGGLTMTGGSLTANGSQISLTVTGTTTISGANLYAEGGATLGLQTLASYTQPNFETSSTLQASGTGSTLSLPALTAMAETGEDSTALVEAPSGGDVEMPLLNQITGSIQLTSSSTDGTLDVPLLTTFAGGALIYSGGNLEMPALTDGDNTTFKISGGVALALPTVTSADGASFEVSGGSSLTLAGLTSYTQPNFETSSTLQASGTDSTLSLPALTSMAETGEDSTALVEAPSGGDIEMPLLNQITGWIQLTSKSTDGTLNLSKLATFAGGTLSYSGGNLEMPALTDGDDTTFKISGGVALALAKVTSADGASFEVSGGSSLTLAGLTSYTQPNFETSSTLQASGTGSTLSLPALTAMAETGEDSTALVEAPSGGDVEMPLLNQITGWIQLTSKSTDGTLNLSKLATFAGGTITDSGGTFSLPALTDVDGSVFNISGDTTLDLSILAGATLNATSGSVALPNLTNADGSAINVSGGASLTLPPPTAFTATGAAVTVSGSGSSLAIGSGVLNPLPTSGTGVVINVPQFPQGMTLNLNPSGTFSGGTTFNVGAGAIVNIQSGIYSGGVTFNVGAGAIVNIEGGTFTGGVAFSVGQGAVVDLTGGNTVTYGGTLTGSGPGTVQITSGTFFPALGGVTLNFPGSMFQWTGGAMELTAGNVTNNGTINLSGSNETQIYADGTLYNYGTIIQTGSGDFGLHSDNVSPTTLVIEPGGSYLLESNAGVNNEGLGDNVIDNMGTILKTAGSGVSTFYIPQQGSIANTGTIEVESGTLYLETTIFAQIADNTLTGGTWNALDGSTLEFPSGTSITTNQANIALDGSGATIPAISGLTSSIGSFSLTNGADFTTTGDFVNTGSLTIGAGSTLAVAGGYTQGSSASLTMGIGSAASGNEYGQLAITGIATLAGSVNATLASGFSPVAGTSYPIVTYASETGGSSLTFAGVNSGTVSVFQPVVGPTSIALTTVTSPANLVVQSFTVAANAVAGQDLTVTYQVDNESSNAVTGSWTDSVYLSTQTTLNASSVLLGRVQQDGVAANGQYTQTVTAPVPGLLPDDYYVIVLADSLGLVPELNRTRTELASRNPVQVSVPTIDLGSPISGTISDGQDLTYQLTVPAGQDLAISAGFAALQGGELYVGYQSIPSSSTNLASSTSATQTTQQVVIPDTQAGTYYVLVQGDTGSGSGQSYTLSAKTLPLQVTSVGPSQAGDSGTTTLTIQGAEFTAGTTVSLVPHGGGASIAATQVTFQSSTTLFAQFDLSGAAAGTYDVAITSGGQKATDPSAFTVTSNATPGNITYNLSVPSISRPGRIAYLTLTYANDGGSDALAPLFVVSVTSNDATIGLPGETSFSGSSVQILGIEDSGPAGTLPPGFQGTIEIPYESTTTVQGAGIDFSLQVLTGDSTSMDWSSLESSLQPSYIPDSAWPAVFANLTAEFGLTTASYLNYLDTEANYLSQLGEYTDDVQRLFGFAINTANDALTTGSLDSVTDASYPVPGAIPLDFVRQFNASISGRDTMGPFGLGWTDNWQITASADSQGNVTISDDGSLLYFAINSDGSYTPAPGEYGTLTLTDGAYQYVQTDGTIIAFNSNGTLDYEQDTNGNRITAGYNASGELTSLTASDGSAIAIAYNTQGLISSITEPGGQSTTYTYDASGQHLLTFTDEFGKTTYTYATGPSAADAHALTSLTFADGTGIEWSYDAEGRLASTGRLNGTGPEAEIETYAYPAPGEYIVTNADGDATATFDDDQGNLGETIDALGNITRYVYDSNDNLIQVIAADGTTTTYTYDVNGNMTSETDPLGYTISFTYNAFGEPLTFVNQEGYITNYQYDASGNLLETTNPDGTSQQYVYNSLGEVTSSTDPDGQTITYVYNTSGQLTAEGLPDGTSDTYTYDPNGNMLTADSPAGDWTFTYNSQNLPTTIVEPYGTLTVQYGIDGNITQIVDQTGFTVNYEYNAIGMLSELTDASGNLIESYTYDPAGNLLSETKGNGTSTTYQYDADGDITEITNLAPSGSINSQMAYAYNAVGEVTSMTTGGVTTAYEYDADGELVSASSPGDKTLYAYDPDGNRTSVTDNGVVTNYVSNDVNEYTSSTTNGVTTTYQYDYNGNLIAATTGGQTTLYTFNAINQSTGVSGPNGTFSYSYDALGYQISATVNGQTTNNLIDPFGLGNVAAQFDSSGNLVTEYTYGLGLVSQVTASGTAYYYDYNLQGSTVGITNSAGVYVNRYSYDPFGQVTTISAGIANPFTFVGQYGVSSDGNGLIYMRARYYDPGTGQFASNDPLGFAGGDTNVRRYAGGEPTSLIDPTGFDDFKDFCAHAQLGDWAWLRGWLRSQLDNAWNQVTSAWNQVATWLQQNPDIAAQIGQNVISTLDGLPSILNDAAQFFTNVGKTVFSNGANSASSALNQASKDDSSNNDCNCGPQPPPSPPMPPPDPPVPPAPCIGCGSNNQPPHDPNDLLGPSGYGSAGYLTPGGALPYTIEFSNEKTAEVPADNVVVTEQLSPNLDWSTFQLGTIGFGSYVVNVPPGLTSYSTRVDATATLGVYVDIDASLNLSTGLLTVTFMSLDSTTLDTPSNPLVGFLPPDTDPPDGEGYINYTIQPKPGLATGAAIDAQASIVFDTNAAIATPEVVNTIDAGPPTSAVAALPATTTTPSFTVSWSGSDSAGPGIAGYDVYVSDDGGPVTLWQSDTSARSATFTDQVGQTYTFYSVATDNLGLVQPTPTAPQATTTVIKTPTPTPSPTTPTPTPTTPTPTPTPPPLVTVTGVRDVTNKKHQVTEVLVTFSGAVNAAEADNVATYRLATAGKKGSYTAKNAKVIPLKSAVYDAADDTVMLIPKKAFALTKNVQLRVNGSPPSGLQDSSGRFIDGDDNGSAGSNAIVILSRRGVDIDAVVSGTTGTQTVGIEAVVDALFELDEMVGVTPALRDRRNVRLGER